MWVLPESSRHSSGPRRRQPLERHHQMSKTSLSQESQYQPVIIRGYIFDYCANTTVHGMKYIAERGRHWSERILWSLLCSMAACGSMYLSAKNWQRFVHSPTVSVIESTNFPISNIPFSSVTLCDANRVHWTKAMKFQKRYLPDASNETLKMFHKFVKAISVVEFGDFDIIDLEFNGTFVNTPELSRLNITQLMFDVKPECKEMFSQGLCWWRNKDYNCCEIFELQRTEYGYCYAFNSEVSEVSTGLRKWYDTSAFYLYPPYYEAKDEEDELRPRRTNSYGTWGGLRFKVGTSNDAPPGSNILPGIIFIANNPYDYPQSGRVIPAGQAVYVDIDGQVTYTVERVRTLSVRERDCLYHDEGNSMGLGGYLYHNCISECHLKYTLKYCNCTPYFFYSYRENAPSCDITGYMCLAKYNLVFNYHKPSEDNPFFSNNMEGMECFCLPDCSFPQYNTAMSMSKLTEGAEGVEDLTNIFLDVHFQNPAVVRYRTDVAYGWLDLVVAFGGIAGLCLGCSLLSAAELFYYLTIRLYRHYRLVHPKGSSLPTHKNGMQHKTAFFNMKQYGNHKQKTSPRTLQAISPTSLNMAYIPTTNSIRSYR